MENKFFQKLMLCIIFAAITAGGIQFFKFFVVGSQAEMDKGIKDRSVLPK